MEHKDVFMSYAAGIKVIDKRELLRSSDLNSQATELTDDLHKLRSATTVLLNRIKSQVVGTEGFFSLKSNVDYFDRPQVDAEVMKAIHGLDLALSQYELWLALRLARLLRKQQESKSGKKEE